MAVKVYSTSTCPWCTRAKNYLASKSIAYEEIDVSKDRSAAAEMVEKSGQRGVPVIDFNGTVVIGFDQSALDQLIKQ